MAASRGSFKPGQSGNPGGRPKIAKIIEAATGKSVSDSSADVLKMLYEAALKGDVKAAELFLVRALGKPKETVEISTFTDEEIAEEIEIIAREKLRSMPLEERLRLVADPAPTDTIQ